MSHVPEILDNEPNIVQLLQKSSITINIGSILVDFWPDAPSHRVEFDPPGAEIRSDAPPKAGKIAEMMLSDPKMRFVIATGIYPVRAAGKLRITSNEPILTKTFPAAANMLLAAQAKYA